MQGAIVVGMKQDRTYGKVGGVGFNLERAGGGGEKSYVEGI